MTPEQINTLDLSQLRVAVAEAMGAEKCSYHREHHLYQYQCERWECSAVLPDYPRCANAAMTLVDKLAEDGWNTTIERKAKSRWSRWCVLFDSLKGEKLATGETLPIAICRAFLLTQCPAH